MILTSPFLSTVANAFCQSRSSKLIPGSRIAQEWACDSMSRLEEDLSFTENSPLQQILATDRSIRNSSHTR